MQLLFNFGCPVHISSSYQRNQRRFLEILKRSVCIPTEIKNIFLTQTSREQKVQIPIPWNSSPLGTNFRCKCLAHWQPSFMECRRLVQKCATTPDQKQQQDHQLPNKNKEVGGNPLLAILHPVGREQTWSSPACKTSFADRYPVWMT